MVDYDRTSIPAAYDRARSRSPQVLNAWMDIVASRVSSSEPITILDLGCGTGRFAGPLRARFAGRLVGMDPSSEMLRRALAKSEARHIRYVAAKAEAVPLRPGSVDLVFISMAFHHFTEPERAVSECHRVLRAGGSVFLRAGTAEAIASYPLTPFFPAAVPIMERVLSSALAITALFHSAGFELIESGALSQEIASTHASYADDLEAGADSVLTQLDEAALAEGLGALRLRAAQIDPRPVTESIDFFWFEKQAS